MKRNDIELIQQVLQGDPDAFAPLVKKYQKGVHSLVWRKIGDFHTAQEITQDAFLKAYQKLGTLKNHNQFPGWLYVIAANLCADWFRKNPLPEQSLEITEANEVAQVSYSRYMAEQQATDADESRREIVKKLLQKLPESERTVMTLYYLGEMTINAISEFLGVSPNTVKSRLSRARNRLKKEGGTHDPTESCQFPIAYKFNRDHHARSLASRTRWTRWKQTDGTVGCFCYLSRFDFPIDGERRAVPLPFSETLQPKRHI